MKTINWKKCTKYALLVLAFGVFALNYTKMTGAKYKTESETVTDSARVAKWISGSNVTLDLFKDSYAADNETLNGKDSVKSLNAAKVIAPGTTSTYEFTPTIDGEAPEVAYQFKFNATGEYLGDWTVESQAYEPLKFTLVKVEGDTETELAKDTSLSNLVTELNKAGAASVIEAGALPNNTKFKISWSWPFSVDDATDVKDTALAGKLADGELSVNLSANITVEQVD
ncbi:hypothetical protein GIX45_23445 [Erwinia sp. CPCC 100877]|nr:hypothetical protein [Erwinia sp. CPCC 100877]